MKRRHILTALAASAASAAMPAFAATQLPLVEVFKSPTCGCCGAWVDHLMAAGFPVKVVEVDDTTATRKRYGLPDKFGSCHTGIVKGYVVEGHVPAVEIKRLLSTKPAAIGLAVPGMPRGSPGMEMPDGAKDAFEVIAFGQGDRRVFARH